MKKKITFTMVLCIAICAVAGCSGSSNNVESTTTTAAETTTTTTTAATEAETTAATTETNEEAPAVEGTVIYDANDIMITATEFTTCKEYDNKPCLALDIINNTGKDNVLIDSSEPVTVTYDASTVEKTHIFSENLWEEKQLSEEELAERKGWWTHEGEFTDNDSLTVAVDFLPLGVYTWHVSGSFGEDFYWSGNVRITDDGLYGTMQTVTYNADESYTHGKPVKVKLTEDGDSGILLTYGTGEEYHLVPAAE